MYRKATKLVISAIAPSARPNLIIITNITKVKSGTKVCVNFDRSFFPSHFKNG